MSRAKNLKVAIDARVSPGVSGGVAQAVLGLVHSLGRLDDSNEEYLIVVGSHQQFDWLKAFAGPNQRFVMRSQFSKDLVPGLLKRAMGPLLSAGRYIRSHLYRFPRHWPHVPLSDGFYESLGCDVVHFPHQRFTLCALPTIYNPHDLQHLHYPQFFTALSIATRETVYSAGCHFARTVVVASQWVKDDLVQHYRISPAKVQVIPWGPPNKIYPEPSQEDLVIVKNKYQLEQPFLLYPAVTWPHKNHIRLLEAIAHLRDEIGFRTRLVCTGSLYEPFWPHIKRRIDELKLWPIVKFVGFVPEADLRAIYRLSQLLVMPSLFESDSFPVYEGWLEGVPVTCSKVTSLPEQVMDAALMFDPNCVVSIANAIASLLRDVELCQELRARGYRRLKDFDWERTAKAYRAVYRRAAGYPLSEEDRLFLGWDWMRQPQVEMGGRH